MHSCGYEAAAFSSATSFLDCGQAHRTDCLIADMHMPGMSGLELLHHLETSVRRIPIILITARHDEGLKARALDAGVHCYLAKPFSDAALIACIRSALTDARREAPS
jgi:FixJ family two-component response regulator